MKIKSLNFSRANSTILFENKYEVAFDEENCAEVADEIGAELLQKGKELQLTSFSNEELTDGSETKNEVVVTDLEAELKAKSITKLRELAEKMGLEKAEYNDLTKPALVKFLVKKDAELSAEATEETEIEDSEDTLA